MTAGLMNRQLKGEFVVTMGDVTISYDIEVDRATAALVKDLKQRGLFDDTLIIWGGEFGRTPMAQGRARSPHQSLLHVARRRWHSGRYQLRGDRRTGL